MSWFAAIANGVVGLVISFNVLMFFIHWLEKNHLAGDVEPVAEPFPYQPSVYWLARREHAKLAGFICVGTYATKRHTSLVKGLESIFINPDRTVAAAIVSARFCGLPLKRTVLVSRLADGRVLQSSDETLPADPTGVVETEVLLNAHIGELLALHMRRVARAGIQAVPFATANVQAELEAIALERGGRLVNMGLARWVDPQHTVQRATLRGALHATFIGQLKQFWQVRDQHERARLRRVDGTAV